MAMILEPEYNCGMTLIVAAICQDGIVFAGDGLAVDENKVPIYTKFKKIHHIKNDIFLGVSANNLSPPDINAILVDAQEIIDYSFPYSLNNICDKLVPIIRRLLKYKETDPKFDINFLVCGYDRDDKGDSTEPHVYILEYKKAYKPEDALKEDGRDKEIACIGTVPVSLPPKGFQKEPGMFDVRFASEDGALWIAKMYIRLVHDNFPSDVGGTGMLVFIKKDGYSEQDFDTTTSTLLA